MVYIVKLMPRAKRDLRALFDYIHASESDAALRWYENLQEEISSLEGTPNRGPATPESRNFRHLLYGRKPHVYRIIYRVLEDKKQVDVLHIRHGAQREFSRRDIS
jgi:plasmid stabilization system protein ParE